MYPYFNNYSLNNYLLNNHLFNNYLFNNYDRIKNYANNNLIPLFNSQLNDKININFKVNNNIEDENNKIVNNNVNTKLINDIFKIIINFFCNNNKNNINEELIDNLLISIDNKIDQIYQIQEDENKKFKDLFDHRKITFILLKLTDLDYYKLCSAIKSVHNNNININLTGGSNYSNECFNIDLFRVFNEEEQYNECDCHACNKYDTMTKYLKKSIENNNLFGVVINLIPSFVDKNIYCLIYKLSKPYMEEHNKKLCFFY